MRDSLTESRSQKDKLINSSKLTKQQNTIIQNTNSNLSTTADNIIYAFSVTVQSSDSIHCSTKIVAYDKNNYNGFPIMNKIRVYSVLQILSLNKMLKENQAKVHLKNIFLLKLP